MIGYATLLGLGSSTDNFAVGTSLGLTKTNLAFISNCIISFMNALGAFASAASGQLITRYINPEIAILLAGLIFLYLAIDEIISWCSGKSESNLSLKSDNPRDAFRLGLPMSLNNLAGGAAGGVAGINAIALGIIAFVASFFMMKCGHLIGSRLSFAIESKIDSRIVSGIIFAGLASMQFVQFVQLVGDVS